MQLSPTKKILIVSGAIVAMQVVAISYIFTKKRIEENRTEAYALETLRLIQTGTVKEVTFFNYDGEKTSDELTPAKIAAWEKRIDGLKWLGNDAFDQYSAYRDSVGMLDIQVSPSKFITIMLYDHRDRAWKQIPSPDTYEGIYIAYTPDRGLIMR